MVGSILDTCWKEASLFLSLPHPTLPTEPCVYLIPRPMMTSCEISQYFRGFRWTLFVLGCESDLFTNLHYITLMSKGL